MSQVSSTRYRRFVDDLALGDEVQRSAFNAIRDLGILSILKEFDPIHVSSVVTGLHRKGSDLDFILHVKDTSLLRKTLEESFGHLPGFAIEPELTEESESVVGESEQVIMCWFTYQDWPFELYCSKIEHVNNRALRHLLITERVLNYGGEELRQEVRNRKERGEKTEPALCAVLGISGDPYEELLELEKMTRKELERWIRKRCEKSV